MCFITRMLVALYVLLLIGRESTSQGVKRSKFTVWLPSGRLIQLPCNLNGETFRNLTTRARSLAQSSTILTTNLVDNEPLRAVTMWHNSMGSVIHIGETLPIHLPMLAPGEMDYELTRVASTKKTESTLELPKAYSVELGSSLNILRRETMTTITCKTYKSKKAGLYPSDLPPEQPFTLKDQLIYNQFSLMHYVQPLVIWKYVLPDDADFKNAFPAEWWRSQAAMFCRRMRNIREYRTSPCLGASVNNLRVANSKSHITQLRLTINLSSGPINLLASPKESNRENALQLSYLHAAAKHLFDSQLLVSLTQGLSAAGLTDKSGISVTTSVDIICPSGTHLKHPPIPLPPITLESIPPPPSDNATNTSTTPIKAKPLNTKSSAHKLIGVSMSCNACPPGQAPRTPYSFGPCIPCPRGYFRGSTGWPAASGCLACPEGFTTRQEGSTMLDDCVIDGGMFTQTIVSFAFFIYRNFVELIVAMHENSPSYTKRVRMYLSEEAKDEMIQPSVPWLYRIDPWALSMGIVFLVILITMLAFTMYRLLLVYRFKQIHKKHLYLLRKSVIVGQLNSQDEMKDLLRQDYNIETKKKQ